MSKAFQVPKMTKVEIEHLLHLIAVNERDGWYVGSHKQWWGRSERIRVGLIEALSNHNGSDSKEAHDANPV